MSFVELVNSVLAAKFNEELLDRIEREETANLVEVPGNPSLSGASSRKVFHDEIKILDKLAEWEQTLDENQLAIFVTYLHRFIKIFGAEKISPFFFSHVHHHLHTPHLALSNVIKAFLQDLMADSTIRDKIFETYFNSDQPGALLQSVIVSYSEQQVTTFFMKIKPYLLNNSTTARAVELFGTVVQKQGPHLHEIAGQGTLEIILSILKKSENPDIVASTLSAFMMLLPHIATILPSLLDHMFFIFKRTLCWRQGPIGVVSHPRVNENTISISPPRNTPSASPSPAPTAVKMDTKQLLTYLSELRRESFHMGKVKKIEQAIQTLSAQRDFLSKEEKHAIDASLSSDIESAIQTLRQYLEVSRDTPLKPYPPKPLRKSITLYFQHLYGMFPFTFFQYLNTECATDKYFKDSVSPLLKHLCLAPLFLTSQEAELSTSRWLNREPQQILAECTIDIFSDPTMLSEEVWKTSSSKQPSGVSEPIQPLTVDFSKMSLTVLQKKFIALKNELLVEKYLSKQYLKRVRDLHKQVVAHEADNNQRQALHDMIHHQQSVIRRMKDLNTQQQSEYKLMQDKHNKWTKELEQTIRKLTDRNKELEEQNQILEMKLASQETPVKELQSQLDSSRTKTFELEVQLQDALSRLNKQEDFKKYIDALHLEILTLRQQHQGDLLKIERDEESMASFNQKEDLLADLNSRLDILTNENIELQMVIKRNEETISQLESKLATNAPLLEKSKQMVETSQSIAVTKMNAMEQKFQTLQQVNIGLERRILELEGKLRATTQTSLKPSSSSPTVFSPPQAET